MQATMAKILAPRCTQFHFEYVLKPKEHQLEGQNYIGIGVLARMIDSFGNEVTEYIQDITTDPETAKKLLYLLESCKVSPMCLQMFVEDFISTI